MAFVEFPKVDKVFRIWLQVAAPPSNQLQNIQTPVPDTGFVNRTEEGSPWRKAFTLRRQRPLAKGEGAARNERVWLQLLADCGCDWLHRTFVVDKRAGREVVEVQVAGSTRARTLPDERNMVPLSNLERCARVVLVGTPLHVDTIDDILLFARIVLRAAAHWQIRDGKRKRGRVRHQRAAVPFSLYNEFNRNVAVGETEKRTGGDTRVVKVQRVASASSRPRFLVVCVHVDRRKERLRPTLDDVA